LDYVTKWQFHRNSNEVTWSTKNTNLIHGWKKCHFVNFSEWAGMAMPYQVGPQESLSGIEKLFLSWMLIAY